VGLKPIVELALQQLAQFHIDVRERAADRLAWPEVLEVLLAHRNDFSMVAADHIGRHPPHIDGQVDGCRRGVVGHRQPTGTNGSKQLVHVFRGRGLMHIIEGVDHVGRRCRIRSHEDVG